MITVALQVKKTMCDEKRAVKWIALKKANLVQIGKLSICQFSLS